jgi:hypothetical protein
VRWLLEQTVAGSAQGRELVARGLVWLERAIPTHYALDRLIADWRPDVVLLASVTNPGSLQLDHLKSARRNGCPVAITVWSWDHLSGKAWLRIQPDRLFVWNDVQRREAVDLHNIPANRVVVTGAQCYDQWFDRQPSREREAFYADVGLDSRHPVLLYVCSVLVRPAPSEAEFVVEWIRRLRGNPDPRIRTAGVLIRPHPERLEEWEGVDLNGLGQVAVCGRNPIDDGARAEYFDSLAHCQAVIGLVTSAFLEAAIVGRPVLTLQLEAFRLYQEGTPHFQYLIGDDGFLQTSRTWEGHFGQVRAVLADPERAVARNHQFVRRFIRPYGVTDAATPRFVASVEEMSGLSHRMPVFYGAWPTRVAAELAAFLLRAPGLRRFVLSDRDVADEVGSRERSQRDKAVKIRLRAETRARLEFKEQAKAERLHRKTVVRKQKARDKAVREAARARELGETWGRFKGRIRQVIRLGQ